VAGQAIRVGEVAVRADSLPVQRRAQTSVLLVKVRPVRLRNVSPKLTTLEMGRSRMAWMTRFRFDA